MKTVLAFVFHLGIALLVVPMAALFSGGLLYPVVRHMLSANGPQQFYSDHLFLLVAVTALLLAYQVCDTFSGRSAVWVWIPALFAFGLRVYLWRSTGSVLYHSSVVEHFFTANCQIDGWRDTAFAARCADKLFLMQLVVGTLGYSAGAIVHRIVEVMRRPIALSP